MILFIYGAVFRGIHGTIVSIHSKHEAFSFAGPHSGFWSGSRHPAVYRHGIYPGCGSKRNGGRFQGDSEIQIQPGAG